MKKWFKRSKCWSILPVYTLDGYLHTIIFRGRITAAIFEHWLEYYLLPCMNRWPGDRDILIMDNCKIHKNQRVLDLCIARGVIVEFLPPYSPNFNPTEGSFHDLMAYIRRRWKWLIQGHTQFEEFPYEAVQTVGRGPKARENARGHFSHAGYRNFE